MRKKLEEELQIAAMAYIRLQYPSAISFHVRNEGISGTKMQRMAYGAKSKKMGVLSGVSDIIILEPVGGYHGLMIELKSKKGRVSESQKKFMERCENKNYQTRVCNSLDQVIAAVDVYMNWNNHF